MDCDRDEVIGRLARLEGQLAEVMGLLRRPAPKQWYTTAEMAAELGRDPYTVREWCRLGRVRAEKRATGRGRSKDWMVAAAELERVRNEGLLPLRRPV